MSKIWFITGTSSGFGKNLALELLKQGETVIATARNLEKAQEIVEGHPNSLALALNVTSEIEIEQAVKQTIEHYGHIDVLVNNAGYGYFGAVEESDTAAVRQMFETNFWGLSSITNAFLPYFRKQKSGHIINITSIGGLDGSPGFGYYNATKFAVEGLMTALSKELSPLGIKVTNVEPGPFRTLWAGSSAFKASKMISDYDSTAHKTIETTEGFSGSQTGSPELAAKAIIEVSRSSEPPLHLLMGQNAFGRAKLKVDKLQEDMRKWSEISTHVDYGDENFWS
ncbi:oxidoreductase [Lactovum miscens]|uniref:NAD(P)-dependent dehydrogenase (Short-subunit alcohol dehydrogenase family) n=1 Tax=Lactovum miscens TaxID=190387 RepID=A0A841C7K1_9LACT|nr:oxidoreductase [Lactovum miscens]MBB5888324.1 NAD(P)-dependent dehydrogenase (short-subunit alcohol dehydrogenase family) [Lactovum miscens]